MSWRSTRPCWIACVTGYARDGRPAGSVIPTWEPLALFPAERAPRRGAEYADPELAGRFIVLHLGNLGFGHRTDTIAEAAAASPTSVTFLFVGGGAGSRSSPAKPRRRQLDNIVSGATSRRSRRRASSPAPTAPSSPSTIARLGIMSPCKMNGSLAMGLPIVYAGPDGYQRRRGDQASTAAGSRCARATSRALGRDPAAPIRPGLGRDCPERSAGVRGDPLRSERPPPVRRGARRAHRLQVVSPRGIG